MSKNDLILERVHLGQANEEERAFVLSDPDLFARLKAIQGQDQSFLAAHPVAQQVTAISGKVRIADARDAEKRKHQAKRGLGFFVPIAAIAALIITQPTWLFPPEVEPAYDDRAKGLYPRLLVYRATQDGENETLAAGAVVLEGDVLQLSCVSAGKPHGVVVSIDGAGATTLHFPAAVGGSTLLGGPELSLPHGYELDNAPYFERFFFVSADRTIDVSEVVAAAEQLAASGDALDGDLALKGNLQQATFLVRKAAQ